MFSSPVHYDSRTGEPFIPLPPPLGPHIRLTLPRASDKEDILKNFNDPGVYMFLQGPPFPYTEANADRWASTKIPEAQKYWEEFKILEQESLSSVEGTALNSFVSGFPFRAIREVDEDGGNEKFIGDVSVGRSGFIEVLDAERRQLNTEENAVKLPGDPTIEFAFADFLAPSHHGRGIMSAAIGTVVNSWAVPFMNARHIVASFLTKNVASRRVFEKNGFTMFAENVGETDFTKKGGGVELQSHMRFDR